MVEAHGPRLAVARRDGETVSTLELFFDLVFVLAITQCSTLMASGASADGGATGRSLADGLVVLALLWWSWVGYAWLTSVVDPDDGAVRLVLFGAMAALLVASLCVPDAFGDHALTLAFAYAVVRIAHITVFVLTSRDDEGLRHSVMGLAATTSVGIALLVGGALVHGDARLATWAAAVVFDMGGPLFIDTSGWRLVPAHFAERHGLIMIVALGESIVALGVGAQVGVDAGVIAASVIGVAIAGALWWAYFDVTSLAAAARLGEIADARERNELARDAYSYLHLPMVAAVVLVALGMKTTLERVDHPLSWAAATALAGGAALYVGAHIAFKARALGSVSRPRLVAALALLATILVAHRIDALASVAVVAAVLWALLAYETRRDAVVRARIRAAEHRG